MAAVAANVEVAGRRNWDARDTERDLADYDDWMEVKLAHLEERVIPFASRSPLIFIVE